MKTKSYLSINDLSKTAVCVITILVFIAGGCDQQGETASTTDSQAGQDQTMAMITTHTHAVAGETCFICDPNKREAGRLWCREHGRYEDRCWLCHPEQEDKDRLFCTEHFLYEDECHLCHPELKPSAQNNNTTNDASQTLFCNEHGVPEIECGICQPGLAESLEPGQSLKVRFVSENSTRKAGVRTAFPRKAQSTPMVPALCRVHYNGNALAHITPLASGVIQEVLVDVGSQVDTGDVLVEIRSAEVAAAKSALLAAVVDHHIKDIAHQREKDLVEQKISATRNYQEARAALQVAALTENTARQRLLNLGFTDTEIETIEKAQDSSSLLKVRAPYSGTLVAREAVIGEWIAPGRSLFTLADLSSMWLELSVPEDKAAMIRTGQAVEATFDTLGMATAKGPLVWINQSIDQRSRMVQMRAVVPNDGHLKQGMFGHARITVGPKAKALQVPNDAVQHLLKRPYLFVKETDDLYALRRVSLGAQHASDVEVTAGIEPNDEVVVAGSFTVMSEFLKSRLGAGCVDD